MSYQARILIVDDEPINLDIICAHLENDNYELVTASNGHRPSSCTSPTLLDQKPSRRMF